MNDSTITKIDSRHSPRGDMGQIYLASGTSVAMRLWREAPGAVTPLSARNYESVGYVIDGVAELESEGQRVVLRHGDSWAVPRGAVHQYRIVEDFVAVEATSPPAHAHGRDLPG